jgi:hypothetical protein
LILSLEQSSDLDSTATSNLIELNAALTKHNVVMLLARVKDPVRLLLLKTAPDLFQGKLFWSVADAATDAQHRLSSKHH